MLALLVPATLLLQGLLACDVSYDFGPHVDVIANRLEVTLTWWAATPANMTNVYLSTATGTGCNSGYFGAQFHSDGTSTLLFSMWDSPTFTNSSSFYNRFRFQSLPASGNCKRNALDSSGKSTGVQCSPDRAPGKSESFKLGVPYTFRLAMVEQNASGALWAVDVSNPSSNIVVSIGRIFFVDAPAGLPAGICRSLGKSQHPPVSGLSSYTFMEYFSEPRVFLSMATWGGMQAFASNGTSFPAGNIGANCCDHDQEHNETSTVCLPPQCDTVQLTFAGGPLVPVSQATRAANPSCFSSPKLQGKSMRECWRGHIPSSLSECFGQRDHLNRLLVV